MNVEVFLSRAVSAAGYQTKFELGRMPPLQSNQWPYSAARSDCSGYVAWCLRISRKVDHPFYVTHNGGWFETTVIHKDGLSPYGFFSKLDKPRRGAILVYPDRVLPTGEHSEGHMGIVLEASGSGIGGVDKIIHCSSEASKTKGDAIAVTSPDLWVKQPDSIIVWYGEFDQFMV